MPDDGAARGDVSVAVNSAASASPFDIDGSGEFRPLTVLVVDDSASQRTTLKLLLRKWKLDVVEASSGEAALGVCRDRAVDFIISDWMMPGLSGPALCKEVRALANPGYTYFILMTSKREKNAVSEGLDAGADDFLSKPLNMGELLARMRAGHRLLRMQDDLIDKNRRVSEAFERLNALYAEIDADLRAAAKLQQALIPPRENRCGTARIGICYQPAGHVGGDLVGFFAVSEGQIAVYCIDVSGHGVSSALLTARLSALLRPHHIEESIAVEQEPGGGLSLRDPAFVAAALNERIQDDADTDQYFTMIYAIIDVDAGEMHFCQAGHPPPALIAPDGEVRFVGDGGPPIGLIPALQYETESVTLEPGARLFLYSDGIIECEAPDQSLFETRRLADVLAQTLDRSDTEVLDALLAAMRDFSDQDRFTDDVSGLLLSLPGAH